MSEEKMVAQTDRRSFVLQRDTDVTGVSGEGAIAEGCRFTDGTVTLRWRPARGRTSGSSFANWPDLECMMDVHGHDGKTRVVWDE